MGGRDTGTDTPRVDDPKVDGPIKVEAPDRVLTTVAGRADDFKPVHESHDGKWKLHTMLANPAPGLHPLVLQPQIVIRRQVLAWQFLR
ncbi:hypothetical protein J7E99_31375 [Streptomyces sp. ISL-44]|uniref:hypothetical protein n=1 Tax=Streptomyces sp. ISL-44 TaxID=2819184 RepID=UPI001BE84E32|nr:hypothetical protein [Streptomyces sp. ISL-44]MBT2545082.1 hypothetical protein [Streptomyces sp. ISL-44]